MKIFSVFTGLASLLFILSFSFVSCSSSDEDFEIIADYTDEFFSAQARGCRDFLLFKHDENFTTFLIVQGDTNQLLPDTSSTKIDIASADALQLYIDVYPVEDGTTSAGCFSYCNDVICSGSEHEFLSDYTRWNAQSGILELRRTEIDTTGFFDRYNVTLHIQEACFVDENDDSRKISVTDIEFEDVNVGWLPG